MYLNESPFLDPMKGLGRMARQPVILARRDAACGRAFYGDRRAAHEHRIALEVWYRATGAAKKDSRFVVVRCKRCGGFHVGQKRVDELGIPSNLDTHNPSSLLQHDSLYDLTV